MDNKLENLIAQLKIPKRFLGYQIFIDAITIFYNDPSSLITKDVYFSLSKKYNLTEKQVEGRLTSIIDYIWAHNAELANFNFNLHQYKRPSNKLFLLQLVLSVKPEN